MCLLLVANLPKKIVLFYFIIIVFFMLLVIFEGGREGMVVIRGVDVACQEPIYGHSNGAGVFSYTL